MVILKILFLSLNPLISLMFDSGILKYEERILSTPLLASPLSGFSLTLTSKISSDFLTIPSVFEFGKTFTLINIKFIAAADKGPPTQPDQEYDLPSIFQLPLSLKKNQVRAFYLKHTV